MNYAKVRLSFLAVMRRWREVRMVSKALFSKATDDWATPKDFYQKLNEEFNFNDDPCPIGGTDGLERSWGARCFVNPPYSNIKAFLEKAIFEMTWGNCDLAVFLVPARVDVKWFHDLALPAKPEIRFIKGRLKFGGAKNSAPFPSILLIFRRGGV